MLRKWYIELPILLSAILLSTCIALQIDFEVPEHIVTFERKEESRWWCGTTMPVPKAVAPQWHEGKSLFKSNCASCHNPKADGTGPPLQGVTARWQAAGKYKKKSGEQWLYTWIKNWHEVVDAGYKYGIAMSNSRESQMNVFTTLSDEQVKDILLYIEYPDGNIPQALNAAIP
ncbi:MAG TPA: cytochrome c [Chitinophagales bacterium]|nr:cytochrome c [Chitinophagales bacterium]